MAKTPETKQDLTLSKSQYVKGVECPLALWFYRAAAEEAANNNPKPSADSEKPQNAQQKMGDEVGTLARTYFDNGVEVMAGWQNTADAEKETQDLIAAGNEVIYEATAINPADGTFCSIDILRKVPGKDGAPDSWDMIEVKSSTRAKPYHFDDLSFQKRVFEAAGYKINDCFVMHIDKDYAREGDVDPQKLFKLHNANRGVKTREKIIEGKLANLKQVIEAPQPPTVGDDEKCTPSSCKSQDKCWGDVPLYSIFNVYSGKDAWEVYGKTKSLKIEDIPADMKPTYKPKKIELEAHLSGQRHIDEKALGTFLDTIEYPAYYFDYEAVMSAIPLYEGTKPYQQVPFQFSLHVQEEKGGDCTHVGFLHTETDDPRRALAEALVDNCGDKGSVIVYFKDYEASRNKELAEAFPDLADKILAINERMVDLLDVYKNRWVYDPAQNGSASLKAVLPTYTDISYKDMEIGNGEQAMQEYLAFVAGQKTDPEELQKLWDALEVYCGQDTYAMVVLVDTLEEMAGRKPSVAPTPAAPNTPKP